MSSFRHVDAADDPGRLVRSLDDSALGLGAMKAYAAAVHARESSSGPVLDLGCGAGHDLALLANVGVRAVGVDPSEVMAHTAARRGCRRVMRASGERLPFRDASLVGCRIERVLMHVTDPRRVLAEVARTVAPGGIVTVFEPDWTSLRVAAEPPPLLGRLDGARHPAIGVQVGDLLREVGCTVVDRVEERSWWTHDELVRITDLPAVVDRAVATGAITRAAADRWLADLRDLGAAGVRCAQLSKVLWVAHRDR